MTTISTQILRRIHNTDQQCYEFWVRVVIPSSFRWVRNDEKSIFEIPSGPISHKLPGPTLFLFTFAQLIWCSLSFSSWWKSQSWKKSCLGFHNRAAKKMLIALEPKHLLICNNITYKYGFQQKQKKFFMQN